MADPQTGWFRGAGGVVWEMDLPLKPDMAEQLLKGYLTRVNADGSPYSEPVEEQPPAANAPKAAWVGYAHRVHKLPHDVAEDMTKQDLVEKYGSKS